MHYFGINLVILGRNADFRVGSKLYRSRLINDKHTGISQTDDMRCYGYFTFSYTIYQILTEV